jgi:hypothetical protein
MRAHRVLPLTMLVALGFAPTAAAGVHGGDRDYGEGRVQVKTIARGLDSPRHLAFGDRGELYVAEAGRGSGGSTPCLVSAEGPGCFGATGAVTKLDRHGRQYRIVSGLASLANIGPDAPAGSNGIGPHGLTVTRDGDLLITNGGPTAPTTIVTPPATPTPLTREALADINPVASQFGKVFEIGDRGRLVQLGDIWDYERDFNPDAAVGNPEIDSNVVDVLEDGNRLVIADAGGNALDTVDRYGRVKALALFGNGDPVPPPFPGAPIPPQAVPTSVVKGPDGFYYVSQLTGFPFPAGKAKIFRVNPTTGAVTTFATGFTNLMDLAFDRDGTLYALSIDKDGLLTPEDEGALWAVSRNGTAREIALPEGSLPFPGGLTIEDGDFYVSINAGSPGGGKVVRIHRRGR